jgi:hypothetical protein
MVVGLYRRITRANPTSQSTKASPVALIYIILSLAPHRASERKLPKSPGARAEPKYMAAAVGDADGAESGSPVGIERRRARRGDGRVGDLGMIRIRSGAN